MNYESLKEFISRLESEGELVRITEPVSPILEIAEVTDRVSKSPDGGKALLFENVEGSAMPVLINAFGSWRRIQMALGVSSLEKIAREIERFIKIAPPATLMDKAKLLPMLLQASSFPPKTVSAGQASCQEVVMTGDAVDLDRIPILQCWPNDAGRFITYPIVINRSLDQTIRNVGLYRMQVFDKQTTAMHWHIHKDGAHFFHRLEQRQWPWDEKALRQVMADRWTPPRHPQNRHSQRRHSRIHPHHHQRLRLYRLPRSSQRRKQQA